MSPTATGSLVNTASIDVPGRRHRGRRVGQHGDRLRHAHPDRRPVDLEDRRPHVGRRRRGAHLHDRRRQHRPVDRDGSNRHRHHPDRAHRRRRGRVSRQLDRRAPQAGPATSTPRSRSRAGARRRSRSPPTVDPTATGTLSNTAEIAGPLGFADPTTVNNVATDTTTITRRADLQVTKSDGVGTEIPGTSVTYTIVASNPTGPSAITGATVTDTLPGSLDSASWTCVASAGSSCTPSGSGDINANVDLLVGGTATFTLTANIDPEATGTLDNTATIAVPTGVTDPTPGNNTETDSDTLTPTADLSVTIDDGALTEVPGTDATYTVVATNAGPSAVTGTTISVPPPAILTGLTWTCSATGGAVCSNASGSGPIAEVADLPPGGTLTYTVTGDIDVDATGNLSVPASISTPVGVTDPTPADNDATDVDGLTPTGDLQITKTDSQTDAVPGESITYTIVVSNPTGPSDMLGAVVADTDPVRDHRCEPGRARPPAQPHVASPATPATSPRPSTCRSATPRRSP